MVDGSGLEMYSFQGDVSWYFNLTKDPTSGRMDEQGEDKDRNKTEQKAKFKEEEPDKDIAALVERTDVGKIVRLIS